MRQARDEGKLGVKLVEITKEKDAKGKTAEISVEVKSDNLDQDTSTAHEFKEIKKGVWNNPESDIAELTNSDKKEVKKSLNKVLKKIGEVHSGYRGEFKEERLFIRDGSLTYAKGAREAAHHGFMAGALVNFRYRHNLRVYLEQFAGRGYADIVLVPRGRDRSLNAVPIIIELKAGTAAGTTPGNALEQAKDYAKGFQPNTMRVLTISDNVLCVGLNLDSTGSEKFSMYISPPADRKPARPTIQKLLEVTSSWSGEESAIADLKKEIKQPLERIYHTFPGTPEKGGNYFSRFLLGQLLLANEFKRVDLKRFIFLYDEYPLDSTTKSGKPVTTFTLIRGGRNEEVFIFHVREGGRGNRSSKKILMPDNLTEQSKITEVYISLREQKKSDFFNIEEVNRYDSLSEYKKGKDFFKGKLKEVPYLNGLREAFDEAFKSQVTPATGKILLSVDKYNSLTKRVGEGMFPFRDFINEEAHFQGVLHGAFSYYSDLKLKESPRALILTEFQTGRGKRIDMVVHGISTDKDGNAKEYDPVGLELKGPREGKTANALKDEANKQISDEYTKGVTYKTLTDGKEVDFVGVVFDKKASSGKSLIQLSNEKEFTLVKVVHSSIFSISQRKCSKRRKQRSTGMSCIDSFDEEKITKEEKEKLIKELFGIEAYNTKIISIDSPQVRIDGGKMNVKFKDNDGNDKELIIDNATNIKNIENYILDKKNLEIKLKVSSDKEYVIIEEIKEQGSEYYLKIDDYRIKLDSIFEDGKEVIFNKLHQLSNDKQLLENKKYIEDIGDVQTNQDYSSIVEEIRQNLLAKGVREDTFDRFKSHFDDLGEKVFADYISNVESSLQEKGIAFDRDKFDSAKIKGAKGGKFFSMMAIYDLLDSIGDTATLGRHNNDGLKQVFGINGVLDAMDDVRTSVSISSNSKVGKLIGKIPGPARQAFVKIISNPVVQSITFATIAYQFGYSINEIAQGNHHPLNYYWTTSSGVKLASMGIRPISASVSFTVKSVSATTKVLRGLSATSKVLSRAAIVTMVADVLITIGIEIHERMEYTKAIAEQVPLLPGSEQAEVFFAKVIKFFSRRDVEKEYEDTIRIKGYLTHVKEAAIKLLNDNYDIDAVVQYVISIEEKYSEVIKNMGAQAICIMPSPYGPECATRMKWTCDLEKKYKDISFDKINIASSVKRNLSSIDISKILTMTPYTLVMSKGRERFICGIKNSPQCYQEIEEKKVYVVNTDAKHIPHLTKYEYENLGLRIVDAPLTNPIQKSQCSKTINTKHTGDDAFAPCNSGKIYRNCQESFTLSGEPFIFTNPKRKDPGNTKKQTFPRGSVLYISGPKTLTAAANYPAVMHIPEGSNIRYVGSKNNETIFIINDHTSGTLEGGEGKENTLVMNVKANKIVADLYSGTIHYGSSDNIRLVNTYNYVSNSDSKQNIITNCGTRFINVKNAEVCQNSLDCTDKDYEVRVVNEENLHHRGLKQTIFVVNEDSDNARIVNDLRSTGKIKGNIDVIRVQVNNITQWRISEDIEKGSYSLDLLANNGQSIVSSTEVDDFKNLVIQVNCHGITESVAIEDKSLSDTIEDIRYQKLKSSGSDISREVIHNSAKELKAFIQASILDQELLDTYQIAKDIVNNNNFDIPVSQVEVIKNHMGVPNEKVIIAGMYSGQVIVDFNYNNSDVTSSYQKYLNNGQGYGYDDYVMLCNYYQDITIEGEKGQHQYIIKLPDTLNSKISSSPIRLNLKIKNKVVPYQSIPYSIIDFAELNVMDVDNISTQEGKRSYINECYNQSISDLTEDSLEIQDITMLDSKGTKWSLSVGLVDYFKNPENQQIVLRINNELYKIDSTNSKLEHVEMDPNSFRYYQPDEQGLQIYHNQPIDKNEVGLVDFRDKSILDFDTEITDDSLVLSHKNNTLAKVENWNTYQPAREMIFAFNDTIVSNSKCIVSICNSEDVIVEFNKEKVTLLKEQMFDAIVQDNINEAKDLIRKIESINTESRHELTPLYVAIQAGRLDIVEILFDRKHFSVKDKDIHGCNPLHWAAQEGKLNIAKFLVDKGADIGAKGNDGRTPLHVAACSGDLDMVKFFLDKNASIEAKSNDPYKMMGIVESAKKEIINQADTSSNVKRWAECFVEKLRYSIKSVAKKELENSMLNAYKASNIELTNKVYNFDKKLFDELTKEVINDVYGKVDTKKILSCVRSHDDISQRISGYVAVFNTMQRNNDLNNGAVFKLVYYIKEAMEMEHYPDVDQEKKSHLEELKSRLPESVRNAAFSSKVCIKNIYQNEYLYAANSCFNYDSNRRRVFTWISKGALTNKFKWKIKLDGDNFNIVNAEFNENLYAASDYFNYDNDRRMVFTWVSGGGVARDVWMIKPDGNNCSIMNVKLKEHLYAADYAKYDNDRRRVFTWIPGGKVTQGVWKIEDCGSTVRKVRNADAGSSLDIVKVSRQAQLDHALLNVTKVGNISEVTGLVNQGANVNTEDRDGNTPARNAVLKGHFGIFKYLVENGVSLEGKDHRCGPSICDASYSGNLDILKYLISKCVDINDTDKNGWTPLHFAAWRGYLEVANFLIEKGADINAENIFGRKPIHIAAENNNKDIIDFFLSKGMSIDDFDRYGRTPLYCAAWNGHLGVVKYLVDRGADVYTQDKGGKTLLDIATDQKHNNIVEYLKQVQLDEELLIVAQYGNLSKVEDLVSQGASLSAKYSDGRTLMHCAAYGGELNVVKYLVVGEKSSLKIKDNSGRIPLHYVAYNGKLDVVKYFIDEKKIDVNIKDNNGWTSLHWASWGGHLDVVKYLIDKKANINAKDKNSKIPLDVATGQKYDDVVEYLQQTQLSLNKQLIAAVQGGDLSKVKNLVSQGTSLDTKYNDGWTLMHYAAYEGRLDIVKYLVDKWAILEIKYNDGRTFSCNTPLDSASDLVNSYFDTMKCLVGKENSLEVKDNSGKTPLHCAASNGKLDIVKYFVDEEKIDASIKDNSGWTLLHWAAWNGHLDVAKYLIGRGANLVNIKDKDGKTPLDIADQKGYTDIVEILKQAQSGLYKKYNELLIAVLENNLIKVKNLVSQGTSLETKDSYGWTLLHFASIYNYSDMVGYLINKGVDINARDQYGKTPLHLTSWFNRLDAMKCLISNNADINAKDNNGKTPLDDSGFNSDVKRVLMQAHLDKELLTTVEGNYLEKIKGLIAQDVSKDRHGAYYYAWSGNLNMVKFLVEGDVDVNATDKYGCTLLHWATLKGHLDVAKFLASKGANVNAEDILGRKPIHFAVINDHRNIIEFLLDKGIIVNSADKQGHTPLHWASWSGHLDIVKYLIDKGANINAKCETDRTPLDIARGRGHSNIVKYLEEKLNQEREKPVQRRRRHHHGDHNRHQNHLSRKTLAIDSSNQHEIAASSAIKPSSWINDLFNWVKGSVGGLLNSKPTLSKETSNTSSPISQVDAKMDVNGTIMLLDLLIRKVTGQKYISTVGQSISPLEAQGYALNIIKGFEKVVEQAGLKSGVSMHRLNIDFVEIQKEVTGKIMSGKFDEISGILNSYLEEACPGKEVGCPGKLSEKRFNEFMAKFNKGLDVIVNQSIQQILHNRDGILEIDGVKKQQMSLEPQSYLSNASIQSHSKDKVSTCLSDIGVTKLGGNLNR